MSRTLFRLLASSTLPALLFSVFLHRAQSDVEAQIDKMQEAAFNTPGAESPVSLPVVLGGLGLLAGHVVVGRGLFRLHGWRMLASLVMGVGAGIGLYAGQLGSHHRQ